MEANDSVMLEYHKPWTSQWVLATGGQENAPAITLLSSAA